MAAPVPSRGSEQFVLRMPDGMRDQIKRAADHNGRSMNSEIVARLERSFLRDADATAIDTMAENTGASSDVDSAFAAAIGNAIRKVINDHNLLPKKRARKPKSKPVANDDY